MLIQLFRFRIASSVELVGSLDTSPGDIRWHAVHSQDGTERMYSLGDQEAELLLKAIEIKQREYAYEQREGHHASLEIRAERIARQEHENHLGRVQWRP